MCPQLSYKCIAVIYENVFNKVLCAATCDGSRIPFSRVVFNGVKHRMVLSPLLSKLLMLYYLLIRHCSKQGTNSLLIVQPFISSVSSILCTD